MQGKIKMNKKSGTLGQSFGRKRCTQCKDVKPTLGGTSTGKPFWKCKECKLQGEMK